jgi:hypothetical protein
VVCTLALLPLFRRGTVLRIDVLRHLRTLHVADTLHGSWTREFLRKEKTVSVDLPALAVMVEIVRIIRSEEL